MTSTLSLPIAIRSEFYPWLDRNFNEVCYTYYRQLQRKLDANREFIRDIAGAIPRLPWSNNKIDDILSKESPGDEMLHLLGVLNKSLNDIITYMTTAEFWPGLEIFLEPFPPILQRPLPRKLSLKAGQPLTLSCKAAGIPALIYQWYYYHGQTPLKIEGEDKSTLQIAKPDWLNDKSVLCSICNVKDQIFTSACRITIVSTDNSDEPVPPDPITIPLPKEPKPSYAAKDKVALLIGNGKYLSEKELRAPPNDIRRIGKRLQQMKFKTLICKDLTKASMENVLQLFTNLLVEDGVYGVLYFAGHGFETSRGCFLVPSDSPTQVSTDYCVSYRHVLNQILAKNPALCLVVLDICRVRKAEDSTESQPVTANSTTMVVYATNEDKKAYEMKEKPGEEPLSVFASHLLRYIQEPIPLIELMMNKVVPSISQDRLAKKHGQLAEISTTLSTQRSLHDPIDSKGATMEFELCKRQWISVTQRPELQEHFIPSIGVTVKMVFTHEYSNSLIIYIGCIKKDSVAYRAHAYISLIQNTPTVSCEATHLFDPDHWPERMGFRGNTKCMSVSKNVLDGIETLESDLIVNVTVYGSKQDNTDVIEHIKDINLKRPLLAKLNLGARGKQNRNRVAVQHEEDTAVEHDEVYQTVAIEQNSYMQHSQFSQYSQS
ncbi:mucosa-associated lymphoid tissue lymphoma translocation protein 1 homolog [Watersipora subatra]|uniref:mucosa-associated lymphoid tissue lymphoma translocation protein 1 homolog n=1 Tax=Watersipora subatra TaxID=2589382 RepID=UPI00355C6B31